MKTAFLFSGQGAQSVGMGKELHDTYPCAAEVFEKASQALGFSMQDLCFTENTQLHETEYTQPALLTTCMAAYACLQQHDVVPDAVAGLSLGEYSAYTASGVFSLENAVTLVRKRGRFMTEAVPAGQGAMLAVMGLSEEAIAKVCEEASDAGFIAPANYNAPGQIVLAGIVDAIEKAAPIAKSAGAKLVARLQVAGPFHTALLQPASERLAKELEKLTLGTMQIPLITNVTGEMVTDASDIVSLLTKQVMSPVQWEKTLHTLHEKGVDTFVEIGPGRVLSGFVKRTLKGVRILQVEDCASLEKTLAALSQTEGASC